MEIEKWYGREYILPKNKANTLCQSRDYFITDCILQKGSQYYCGRCLSQVTALYLCEWCQSDCYYCHQCIEMGKVCACCQLVAHKEPECHERRVQFVWQGTLSTEQAHISQSIVAAIEQKDTLLVSAVTGSGKTEMLFQGIHFALEKGYRICVAAPRIDVCLELDPRLKAVFPDEDIIVLYGDMKESYRYTKLVIATTHQLLKFKKAFDVLIIDEVDSFPFQNNDSLQKRVPYTLKEQASLIYLTATPTVEQQKQIRQGKLKNVSLPARYHRHFLPVPKLMYIGDWKQSIQKQKSDKLVQLIIKQLRQEKRFLVFFPHIDIMLQFEQQLRQKLPKTIHFTSVSARDLERIDKVQRMRQEDYHFLLTTTILERGVTFANIDVIVIGSEDYVFTTASLVQIAGRVGRKADYPTGEVLFCHNGISRQMKQAVRWIKKMNKQAKERGLIDE